jgi:hypothetical protein
MQIFGDAVVTVLWINAVYENRDYREEQSKSDVSPKASHRIPRLQGQDGTFSSFSPKRIPSGLAAANVACSNSRASGPEFDRGNEVRVPHPSGLRVRLFPYEHSF